MTVGEFLKKEFLKRSKRKGYSLRAFARDLGISASWLSRILSDQRGISMMKASLLAKKLSLTPEQEEYFIRLVESQFSRSDRQKKSAQKKLTNLSHEHSLIEAKYLDVISKWHSFAILSLLETKHPRQDAKWIAKKLQISEKEASVALEKLLEYGMLAKVNGRLKVTGHFLADQKVELPNHYIQEFHQQMLQNAFHKIPITPIAERALRSVILGVDPNRMDEAKVFIKEMTREFQRRFCLEEKNRTEVMAFSVQYFPLSQMETG